MYWNIIRPWINKGLNARIAGNGSPGRNTTWRENTLLLGISFPLASLWAVMGEYVLVPDPCLYHAGRYLGMDPPWWIEVFFPLDASRHPTGNLFYYATATLAGTVGMFLLLKTAGRGLQKRIIRSRTGGKG
jgi:hypothetical protein